MDRLINDDKLTKFNLELRLFFQNLNSFGRKVNEIDDNTVNLFMAIVARIDDLMTNAKFRDIAAPDENEMDFAFDLNEKYFQFRRYITCFLCHEQIPLTRDDFIAHIRKKEHKIKEMEDQTSGQSPSNSNQSSRFGTSTISLNTVTTMETPLNSALNLVNGQFEIEMPSTSENYTFKERRTIEDKLVEPMLKSSTRSVTEIESRPSVALTLLDFEQTGQIDKIITDEIKIIESSTVQRHRDQRKIIETLRIQLNSFDSQIRLYPHGSRMYDIGNSNSDFNILIETSKSNSSFQNINHLFNGFSTAQRFHPHFNSFCLSDSGRVLGSQLKMIHMESSVKCSLLAYDEPLSQSMQIIRNCMALQPMCRYLVIYVKIWQDTLNRDCKMDAFHFNSYILTVMVIFFLQTRQLLPTISNLTESDPLKLFLTRMAGKNRNSLSTKDILCEFFKFYGESYEFSKHIISPHIGKWQERQLPKEQKYFSPAQQRLREAIALNPLNWKNCTMYVQDLVRPGINITADITKREAENFQSSCKIFSQTLDRN